MQLIMMQASVYAATLKWTGPGFILKRFNGCSIAMLHDSNTLCKTNRYGKPHNLATSSNLGLGVKFL